MTAPLSDRSLRAMNLLTHLRDTEASRGVVAWAARYTQDAEERGEVEAKLGGLEVLHARYEVELGSLVNEMTDAERCAFVRMVARLFVVPVGEWVDAAPTTGRGLFEAVMGRKVVGGG